MTNSEALQIISDCSDCGVTNKWGQSMDYQFSKALSHISNRLGMVFDKNTQKWVSIEDQEIKK